MSKNQAAGKRAKRRDKRRQAVHQAMHPEPVATTSARSKRSQALGVRQPLLTLIPQLILASININGLCPETEWAISSLLEEHRYDVRGIPLYY